MNRVSGGGKLPAPRLLCLGISTGAPSHRHTVARYLVLIILVCFPLMGGEGVASLAAAGPELSA